MDFMAEVIEVKVKKLVSDDKEYKIVMVTDDPRVLQLAVFVNEEAVRVQVKGENEQ